MLLRIVQWAPLALLLVAVVITLTVPALKDGEVGIPTTVGAWVALMLFTGAEPLQRQLVGTDGGVQDYLLFAVVAVVGLVMVLLPLWLGTW